MTTLLDALPWVHDPATPFRIAVCDGAQVFYLEESAVPANYDLYSIALSFARHYPTRSPCHVVARIEDVSNGQVVNFAFNGEGHFEWPTKRLFVID